MASKPSEPSGGTTERTQIDSRFDFLASVVHKSLRLKPDRWAKLMSVDEAKRTILDFLDHAEPPLIVFTQSGPGILGVTHFPLNSSGHPAVPLSNITSGSTSKLKSLFFLKKRAEPVNLEDPRKNLLFGDLSTQPLDQVLTFLEEIVAPILYNTSKGRESGRSSLPPWPTAVSSELERQLIKSRYEYLVSQELPTRIEMESCIQQWTQQLSPMLESEETDLAERRSLNEEIIYWKNRSQDLENIFEQLKEGVVRQMAATLEAIGSAQSAVFKTLLRRVITALAEAQEIALHLKPITKPLDVVQNAEVMDLVDPLRVLLHTISLLWCTCPFFRQPVKLAHLLRQIGHALIERCRAYLDARSIFTWEIEEATEKITIALKLFGHFRHFCAEEQQNAPVLVRRLRSQGRCSVNLSCTGSEEDARVLQLWAPPHQIVFERVVRFEKRLACIMNIFNLIQEFNRLSRLELSAMGGRSLTLQIQNITQQFGELKTPIISSVYGDCMDPDNDEFDKGAAEFNQSVIALETKVTSVVGHALNDVSTAQGAVRIIHLLGSFLQRPLIQKKVLESHNRLVTLATQELVTCMDMYRSMQTPDGSNCDVPSTIQQLVQLERRARTHVSACWQLNIDPSVLGMKSLNDTFNQLHSLITGQKQRLLDQWTSQLTTVDISRPLLVIVSGQIHSGADANMGRTISEFRHLRQLMDGDLTLTPLCQVWTKLYPTIRARINLVDAIVCGSVTVEEGLTVSIRSLFLSQLKNLKKEIAEKNTGNDWLWDSPLESVDETLRVMAETSLKLHRSMKRIQATTDAITKLITTWLEVPIIECPDDEGIPMDDQLAEVLTKRYLDFSTASKRMASMVRDTQKFVDTTETSDVNQWIDYLESIDCIVIDGLAKAIVTTLQQLKCSANKTWLYNLQITVTETGVHFDPLLESDDQGGTGIVEQFNGLLAGITRIASHMTPLSPTVDYQQLLDNHPSVVAIIQDLRTRMINATKDVHSSVGFLYSYSYLWTNDRREFLETFLQTGCYLGENPESHNKAAELNDFRMQLKLIDDYKTNICTSLRNLEYSKKSNWLKLFVKPAYKGLAKLTELWRNLLLGHVSSYVLDSVGDLENFLQEAEEGLIWRTVEGEKDISRETLLEMMGYLAGARQRQATTDAMFEPLDQAAKLLEDFDHQLSEEVLLKLQNLPQSWENIKQSAAIAKQQVATLQATEVAEIKKALHHFEFKQLQFRDEFQRQDFFKYDCQEPYVMIDQTHLHTVAVRDELKELTTWSGLFEVPTPEFKPLANCVRDCKLVKQLWDYIYVVRSSVDNWKLTFWKEIDVERLEIECKHYAKDIRGLDKEMRPWGAYIGLEASVRDLLTSLKAISDLQNPAVKERHWASLIEATKRKSGTTSIRDEKMFTINFVNDSETTLGDLLSLQLHRYEEEVRSVVDRAVREISMEKTLRELETTWSTLELDKEIHTRTGLTLLKASDDLIATLEDNQVQLQTLATSKYVAHLMADVLDWQRRLGLADSVLSLWCEVQRSWSHLESIFAGSGSDDIRVQLPLDADRFDETNTKFKTILIDLMAKPNVINVALRPGILDQLQELDTQLQLCEKALAQYLESKRMAFPRFYFVATADLLDILSNGTNPSMVQKHLTKLFDAVARINLEPIEPDNPKSMIQATGVWAKDSEYVPLIKPVQCIGQVESWLNGLVAEIKSSLRHLLHEAVTSVEERPKDAWIWDFPAQVALTASQITWNAEVSAAFQKLEEGYENAMKDLSRKQISQLNSLVSTLVSDLSPGDRQKVMTLCTIDVHSREVVMRLVQQKVESSQSFPWQSQLRHCWSQSEEDCFVDICDARFRYWYEYLGNTSRLVVTPLTDRCYITLTQSLHLIMGGAPAGPAGTGKTETTKDLGRALGVLVYVFNCSEQMDYKTTGNIYKGLAQTGGWGCFDEFNRISIEVLSVVAVQIRAILDALRQRRQRFFIMEDEIALVRTVGLFVTMNPGYAGRSDLPENLKSLFRPCAMIVPDSDLICEIMLVAEGFFDARALARKLVCLYSLCRQLLSKQDHYDWGLRAIKSVLVLAGSSKRNNQASGWGEEQLLLGALRDANLPRLISDDVSVFLALLNDLFPAVEFNRTKDSSLEKTVRQAAADLKLQAEDIFVMRVLQMHELLQVRHSVFMLGAAGTGKTAVWRTLLRTYALLRMRPICADLDPKAVTSDELFGYVNPTTREWKDGLLSSILREQAAQSVNNPNAGPKWIVLDGDIDPNWIESLNTLMDDNKVLTLASNERIALTPQMRLIFEISHLKSATPSSVSRAGILHLNSQDLGWSPYVTSWIESRCAVVNNVPVNSEILSAAQAYAERNHLTILMDKYVPSCLEVVRTRFKPMVPMPEICHLQMLCRLLDCLLTAQVFNSESPRELYELYFVFACIWAFGSTLSFEAGNNIRLEFSLWWNNEFKAVRFPSIASAPTVFDYFIDPDTNTLAPWTDRVPKFDPDPDLPVYSSLVPTAQTTCIRYFVDLLVKEQQPVLLVGPSGCGKTAVVEEALGSLPDEFVTRVVPFHHYMTSELLQGVLERSLEKKGARTYGPPGNKKIIFFLDDFNSPAKDLYGTAQAHTLLRQHLSYGHWYDRNKLLPKEVRNIQFIACMNPSAGTFTIDPRLHRHFISFAVSNPGPEVQQFIFSTWLQRHFANPMQKFIPSIQSLIPALVAATMALHLRVCSVFRATATKFLYQFTLRDMASMFKGLLLCTPETVTSPLQLLRLWIHEAYRVYADRLSDDKDVELFKKAVADMVKKCFDRQSAAESSLETCCAALSEVEEAAILRMPLLFCHFARGLADAKYGEAEDFASLAKILNEALTAYNELNPAMDLVLFEDAISHICRINRILELPRGHALLVGVGGSGKQSLARLAASVGGFDVSQLHTRAGYGLTELKTDLSAICLKTGLKKLPTVLLVTDAHILDETLLGPIHDFLAAGEIPGLFSDDEVENIVSSVRNEVKALGLTDSRDLCWRFFLEQIRRHLHIILCCSPVGSVLRLRVQRYPALLGNMAVDYFLPWPHEALISVSQRYLSQISVPLMGGFVDHASNFMAYVHSSVNDTCRMMLQSDGRYAYTTPKSFLEQLQLFCRLLEKQTTTFKSNIERLDNGLDRLRVAAVQVDELKEMLAIQEVDLQRKTEEAERLIQVVRIETEKVRREKILADAEEKRVAAMAIEVTQKQRDCEEDLTRAEPALVAAQEALNTLNKANLTELRSFGTPPLAVTNVTAAVLVLLSPQGRIPKDRTWKASKIMMGRVDQFLDTLINYDKEHIHPDVIKAIQPYMDDPEFDPEQVRSKSTAAAGLCSWVINIMRFFEVFCKVEPKRRALETANAELIAAREKETAIKAKVSHLVATLEKLTHDFERANTEKKECHEEAERTTRTLLQANRLIHGLASEKVRWYQAVDHLKKSETTLAGDYRNHLVQKCWIPFITSKSAQVIVLSENFDPVGLLADAAQIASWNNEGLPSDGMSIENAAILTICERWPLLIDPQLQGINWVRGHYGERLEISSLGVKGFTETLERCLREGRVLLIENINEELDNSVQPLMSRQLVKKGKAIKIGDKEVDYNPDFRLILHTKIPNPHFRPELQAQATLLNFTVTRDGLEEQLLAETVRSERPDLEKARAELVKQENDFKIALKGLEDDLLLRLSKAQGEFLADTCLVDSLEKTKATSNDIIQRSAEAAQTAQAVNQVRELYRPAASRASLLFFIIGDLQQLNPIYQFSLKAFIGVFQRAIARATISNDVSTRVHHLVDAITYALFQYVARSLFEADRLVFTSQMTFQILLAAQDIEPLEVDFFLRFPVNMGLNVSGSPVDFLSPMAWNVVKGLASTDEFRHLDRDIEASPKRWRKIVESEFPERERLPQEWKAKSHLRQLCVLRALRPDRLSHALCLFIEEKLGGRYVESLSVELAQCIDEMSPGTPLCFILSPGVNPLLEVEIIAKRQGRSMDNGRLHLVSLGQGQEGNAQFLLEKSSREGHWVILQNIHLVKRWLPVLERTLENCANSSSVHVDFKVFLSVQPPGPKGINVVPQGLLESCIKLTSEPPRGIKANLHMALDHFTQESLEQCTREAEFKTLLFALCYFHAVATERRHFGAQGWNRTYPFSAGDLTISVNVLLNYIEGSGSTGRVPWEDLRYLLGEIMYGGHVTDDWDRRLCRAYLEELLQPELLEGELFLAPCFPSPPNRDYIGYHRYIDEALPPESTYLYGLHPNAEIGILTSRAMKLCQELLGLQPRTGVTQSGSASAREDRIKQILDEVLERLPEEFALPEICSRLEEKTPYMVVIIQECERINALIAEAKRSLRELDKGLKGELSLTPDMEEMTHSLYLDQVPNHWRRLAYPSLLGLTAWIADLQRRHKDLDTWLVDFQTPNSVWLGGFFSPQAFLTAVMQTAARRAELPLDRMALSIEVTKKTREEITSPPREGVYIHGLYLEGARWDSNLGVLAEAKLKELHPPMPVIYVRGVTQDKLDTRGTYDCPVYHTQMRGGSYIWNFHLKSKDKPTKWILAGTALLLHA